MAIMKTNIAGSCFHKGADQALAKLKGGDELLLLREPNNEFDRNAVAVVGRDGLKLGYVPRFNAPAVAKVLDSGIPCSCMKAHNKTLNTIDITWEA